MLDKSKKVLVLTDLVDANAHQRQTRIKAISLICGSTYAKEIYSTVSVEDIARKDLTKAQNKHVSESFDLCPLGEFRQNPEMVYRYGSVICMGFEVLDELLEQKTDLQFSVKTIAYKLSYGEKNVTALCCPSSTELVTALQKLSYAKSKLHIRVANRTFIKALQIAKGLVPVSTRPNIITCLSVEDIDRLVADCAITGKVAFDVETMPDAPGVPEDDQIVHNTTPHLARMRMAGFSPQIGVAYVVPFYDRESPFDIGCNDKLKFYYKQKGRLEWEPCNALYAEGFGPNGHALSSYDLAIKKNGQFITQYNGEIIYWRKEYWEALYRNWVYAQTHKLESVLREAVLPKLERGLTNNFEIRKIAHFANFDYNMMRYPDNGVGLKFCGQLDSTDQMLHTLDKYTSLSLKNMSDALWPEFAGYGADIDYANDPMFELAEYQGLDAELTTRQDAYYLPILLSEKADGIYYLSVKKAVQKWFGEMEFLGDYVNIEKTKELKRDAQEELLKIETEMKTLPVFTRYVQAERESQVKQSVKILHLRVENWIASKLPVMKEKLDKIKKLTQKGTIRKAWYDLNEKINWIESREFLPSEYAYDDPMRWYNQMRQIQLGQTSEVYTFKRDKLQEHLLQEKNRGKKIPFSELAKLAVIEGWYGKQEKLSIGNFNFRGKDIENFLYHSKHGLKYPMPIEKKQKVVNGRKTWVSEPTASTAKDVLYWYEDDTGFLDLFRRYGGMNYVVQTCDEILRFVDKNGFVHTSFGWTTTDRSKSSKPNAQNFTKRTDIPENRPFVNRNLKNFETFDITTYRKYVCDISMAELRWGCYIYKIESMAKALNAYDADPENNPDLHEIAWHLATGKPIAEIIAIRGTPEWVIGRTRGKAVNFGFFYGQSAKGFMHFAKMEYKVLFTLKQAERTRAAFMKRYPEIPQAHVRQEAFIRKNAYVRSPFGNTRKLEKVNSGNKYIQLEAIREGINTPVQSGSAIGMMISGTLFMCRQHILGLSGGTRNLIHDDMPVS